MFEQLRDIMVKNLEIEKEKITMDTDLRKDIDADSAQLLEIIFEVEETFNVELPEDLNNSIKTVGDIVNFLENK